jgi:hypothetical protein
MKAETDCGLSRASDALVNTHNRILPRLNVFISPGYAHFDAIQPTSCGNPDTYAPHS